MKLPGEQLYIAASLIVWAFLFIGVNRLYDLLKDKWAQLPQRENIMKKMATYLRALSGIIAIALEISLYVAVILGKINFFQLVAGFCLLRIAEYCYSRGDQQDNKRMPAPKTTLPRYAVSVDVSVTNRENISYARSACFEVQAGDSLMDVLRRAAENTSVFMANPEQNNITIAIKNVYWEYRGMGGDKRGMEGRE